jgi:general stress protein CsbA
MSDPFQSFDVMHLIWAVPLFQLVHEVEEWNILRWYRETYVDLPASTNLSVRLWIVVFSLFAYVWTTLSFFTPNRTAAMVMILLLVAASAQNGLQHVYWLLRFRKYAPGVITSVLLVLPLDGYLTHLMLREDFLPSWLVLIVFALMLPGLIETVRAGNRMTKTVRLLAHELPIRLIERLAR